MKKFRNILAMLMVFVMLVAVMPMNVFAADPEPTPGTGDTPTVTSIAIDTSSTYKTEYKVGDNLDVNGLKIKVTKSDNSEETVNVTSEMVEGFDSKAATESQKLTITYENQTTTYTVSIKAKEVEVKKFKLTATVEGEGGKVSPESKEDITENTEETVTIEPNENYEIAEVKVNNEDKTKEVTNKKLKLTMTEDKNVVVKFKKTVNEDEKKELEEARKAALAELEKLTYLTKEQKDTAIAKINATEDKKAIDSVVEAAKKQNEENKPAETGIYNVYKGSTVHGSFTVSKSRANYLDSITVTATPNAGYAVKNVYYIDDNNIKHSIKNYAYNDYYYYGYNGRYNDGYYGDYYRYYSDYENNYYYDYSSYDAYLKDRHYSFWNNGYRYWDDYDYKYYNRYYDRYYDGYYRYYDDYYRYYDDYVDNYYRRYSSYEDYLYDKHYSHYRDYRYYDKYDYRYYNYTTTDTFTMPASDVTVYVEFTDWSYYGYYYDDYYYYRYHRDKKDKEKEEKAEEEKKPAEEKTPQVYEASATINIGSKVFTKVNKNVTTTHQMDVAAYVKNGRVMLPLRYVAEALGLQVSWVPQTKTVIIWDLTQKVEIPIKSNKMIVNGVTYTSDVKPEIKNSRTMLPIANVARALGLIDGSDIIWDPVMKQVKLTRRVISK